MNSLISILMAVGLASLVVMFGSQVFMTGQKQVDDLRLQDELLALKSKLITQLDCDKTIVDVTVCDTPGTLVAVKDGAGEVLFGNSGSGTRFGEWTVRAECVGDSDGLALRVARLKPTGTLASANVNDFLPDRLTGRTYTWSSPESLLFGTGVTLCSFNDRLARIDKTKMKTSPWYPGPFPQMYKHDLLTGQYFTKLEMLMPSGSQMYEANAMRLTWWDYNIMGSTGYGVQDFKTYNEGPVSLTIDSKVQLYGICTLADMNSAVSGIQVRTIVVPYGY
jgi:hypothetical protein